jgi:lipase chaperone LimK
VLGEDGVRRVKEFQVGNDGREERYSNYYAKKYDIVIIKSEGQEG